MKIETWIFGFLNADIPEKYRGKRVYVTDDDTLYIYHLVNNEFKLKVEEVNILLNGSFLTKNCRLKNGDQIKIFPPVAGG
jgi:molybdopterin converting factor small subunit